MTPSKILAALGLILAVLTFFVPQIPLAIAVICIAAALIF